MGMSGDARSKLKLVGGNKQLQPLPKNRRVPPWPPLRVVGVDYVPPEESPSRPVVVAPKTAARGRPAWGMMWGAGLAMALAQGIEHAIAAFHG
jgi:hypothetical protein